MTRHIHRGLTAREWVGLTDSQIRARRADPQQRVCYVGHTTFVRPQWMPSIGTWGALDTADMINDAAPHRAMLHVGSGAYRQFKARHHLMTKRQFERHHGPHAWTRAELCFREHARAQQALGASRTMASYAAPVGTASAYAVATAKVPLGLLPVEVTLWSRLFGELLTHHLIEDEEWYSLTDDEKQSVWALGRGGAPWSLEEVGRQPATLYLGDALRVAAA